MSRDDLKQLHWLHEKRKEKALEQVNARRNAFQSAQDELEDAKQAISNHVDHARQQEASGLSGMMGKTLSYADIANFQSELASLADRLAALKSTEKAAGDGFETAKTELKEASTIYRKHHFRVEKLQELMKMQNRKRQRRDLALSEALDDEQQIQRRPRSRTPISGNKDSRDA